MSKPIYIIGDVHGQWDNFIADISDAELADCTLISVGDWGVGFDPLEKEVNRMEYLNQIFENRQIDFRAIRGNHDNPAYFNSDFRLSNYWCVPDYTLDVINGLRFLFVGGAISVDRWRRKEGVNWWRDEKLIYDPFQIEDADVLITHVPPTWNKDELRGRDILQHNANLDPYGTLLTELREECSQVDAIIDACGCKRHYCGHMHYPLTSSKGFVYSRILNINEIVEVTYTLAFDYD